MTTDKYETPDCGVEAPKIEDAGAPRRGGGKKRILIVGAGSYIARAFMAYAGDRFSLSSVHASDGAWQDADFSGFDTVLHCAGIAHASRDPAMEPIYREANCALAVRTAKKAKAAGVGQFIYLSSSLVYGADAPAGEEKLITPETPPSPADFYGQSKLDAEEALTALSDGGFRVFLPRLPMVYGPGCRGNFPRLIRLAKKAPLFPSLGGRRSMLYIESLCEFLAQAIERERSGICLPQDADYAVTCDIVRDAAALQGRRTHLTGLFNPLLRLLSRRFALLRKVFGGKAYVHAPEETAYAAADRDTALRRTVFGGGPCDFRRPKVTVLSSYYEPDVTACTYLYVELAHDLQRYGADVTVVAGVPNRLVAPERTKYYAEHPDLTEPDGVRVLRVGPKHGEGRVFIRRALYHLRRSFAVYRAAKKLPTDAYVICSAPPFMGLAGALLAKRAVTLYGLQDIFPDSIVHGRGMREGSYAVRLFRRAERFIYRRNTHICAISDDMRDTILARGVPAEKISVLYDWIDEKKCHPVARADNPLFDRFGLSRDGFYACYAGNIGLLQNVETILRAAERLAETEPGITFIIIGDGAWRPEMERFLAEKPLPNVRTFPMQPVELISEVYSLGDIGIVSLKPGVTRCALPSKTWSILSAGRPAVCEIDTDGCLCRMIEENGLGACVAPGDDAALAQAILEFYVNRSGLPDMGMRGRRFIEEHLTRGVSTRRRWELLEKLIHREEMRDV